MQLIRDITFGRAIEFTKDPKHNATREQVVKEISRRIQENLENDFMGAYTEASATFKNSITSEDIAALLLDAPAKVEFNNLRMNPSILQKDEYKTYFDKGFDTFYGLPVKFSRYVPENCIMLMLNNEIFKIITL